MRSNRIVRALPIAVGSVLVIHLLELAIGIGVWLALDRSAQASVANRLGTEVSWSAIEDHIASQFQIGVARPNILEAAAKIGAFRIRPFRLGNQYCEAYYFKIGPFYTDRAGPWSLCFNDDEVVTSVERYWYQ
jgi:hypothetical protein